jgi:hypothetical protein
MTGRSRFCWLCLAALALGGCGNDDDAAADADADAASDVPEDAPDDAPADTVDPAWYEPDPSGRVTEGNLLEADPEMVVVAPPELAEAWRSYARHRTLSGVTTQVVTTDEIDARAEGVDEADRVRNYLRERYFETGLRFALLGGDAEWVPFRRVEASVTVPFSGTYTTNGPADLFFAELDADWDRDRDGLVQEVTRRTRDAIEMTPEVRVVDKMEIFDPSATLKCQRIIDERPREAD